MADLFKQKWDAFCDNLKDVGSIIESEPSLNEIDQAEGYRYLLRLMRLSLEMNLEHSNPTSPSFYNLSHETAKIGADNPDNIYLNANINGEQAYEIFGNIGELDYLSVLGADIIEQKVAINSSNLASIREKYFDGTDRLSTEHKYITDKQPQNFLYIALIAAAFPEAKIIHVTRQAAAVCWSNFRNFFSSNGLGYSYTLGDTVKYYKLYENLMGFFGELYGPLIYEVNYDDLVVDQENHTRNLIEHVGLDWQEHVVVDPKFFRPAEVNILLGDSTKAKEKLGWEPETSFTELIEDMVLYGQ